MTKQATNQAAKAADTPDFPAGKKRDEMNEILSVLRPATQANGERLLNQQGAFNTFVYWAQAGSTVETHLAPEFWYALSSKFSPNDELIIKEELGEWRAHFLIRSIGSDGIDIVLLSSNQIGGTSPVGAIPFTAGPRVVYRGQHLRWSVYDGDRELVGRLPKQSDALQWLQNNQIGGALA